MKELICYKESLNEHGHKVLYFTIGKVYEFTEVEMDIWEVLDDNKEKETFFNTNLLFKEI